MAVDTQIKFKPFGLCCDVGKVARYWGTVTYHSTHRFWVRRQKHARLLNAKVLFRNQSFFEEVNKHRN